MTRRERDAFLRGVVIGGAQAFTAASLVAFALLLCAPDWVHEHRLTLALFLIIVSGWLCRVMRRNLEAVE